VIVSAFHRTLPMAPARSRVSLTQPNLVEPFTPMTGDRTGPRFVIVDVPASLGAARRVRKLGWGGFV